LARLRKYCIHFKQLAKRTPDRRRRNNRIYFDSLVFEPQALRYLIDLVGADHVCIGTDAPFDMADDNPKATIDAVPGITPLERQCVCCGTALKLLCEG